MNFFLLFLGIVALIATAKAATTTTPVITYQSIDTGYDFKSEGDIPYSNGYYYYLGGFSNLNQTVRVYFDATAEAGCGQHSLTIYSSTTTAYSMTGGGATMELYSYGKTLTGALDYSPFYETSLNARYFSAKSTYCNYHITARSETK
eukprot:gene13050-14317_t